MGPMSYICPSMRRPQSWKKITFQAYTVLLLIGVSILLRDISISLTGGKLVYGLDDPYIHLALAEGIIEGEYGLNRGEVASPSSSIAYPYLLTLGFLTNCPDEFPFWLSLIAMGLGLWLMTGFLWDRVVEAGDEPSLWFLILAGIGLILSLNAPTFPMMGMEHPWHILGTVMILKSVYEIMSGERRKMAVIGLSLGSLLAPLMRYEGFPLGLAGIAILFLRRYYVTAFLTVAVLAGTAGAHTFMLWKAGLPPFPSSVLAKSGLIEPLFQGNLFEVLEIIANQMLMALKNALYGEGYVAQCQTMFVITFFIIFAAVLFIRGEKRRYRYFWALILLVLFLHLLGGSYGWMGRYEVYVMASMIMGLCSVLAAVGRNISPAIPQIVMIIVLLKPSQLYAEIIVSAPAASANIYLQQYQMHNFAVHIFPHPVAINDLGWVSFGNKSYVLDLGGLASEEVRRLHSKGQFNTKTLREIVQRKKIVYVMIYREWFCPVPPEWCLVAILKTPRVTAAGDKVNIYLVDPAYRNEMEAALDRWSKVLPLGTRLYRFNCLPDSEWQRLHPTF